MRATLALLQLFVVAHVAGQFVRLEGRQFMIGEQPFYPRVMNYYMSMASSIASSQDPNDLYATPDKVYDRSVYSEFECNSITTCDQQLRAHFDKIAEMGFNTIRFGVGPHLATDGGRRFALPVRNNNSSPEWQYDLYLTPPGFSDQFSVRYFQMLSGLLDVAQDAGLKVILLTADNGRNSWNPPDDPTLYAQYLARLADELKDHPALLAYDLWNEPADQNTPAFRCGKPQACAMSAQWFDAINEFDHNHMVTLGGIGVSDMMHWDPSILKLDFWSPHLYPQIAGYFNTSQQSAIEGVKAELCWYNRECPMPYMVGETGFSAEDDYDDHLNDGGSDPHLDSDPAHHRMPWMHGTEEEQAEYARQTMDATRHFGGSGYSWWQFQNSRSTNLLVPLSQAGNYLGNFYGVLKYGDGIQPWYPKQIVQTMTNYPLPAANFNFTASPSSHFRDWRGFFGQNLLTWHLNDEEGNPIQDAALRAQFMFYNSNDDFSFSVYAHYTSNTAGALRINAAPDPDPYSYVGEILALPLIPGRRADVIDEFALFSNAAPAEGSTREYFRNPIRFRGEVENVTLEQGEYRDFRHWDEIQVNGVHLIGDGNLGGGADFHARRTIHLLDFHAAEGSFVHIWNEETFASCSDNIGANIVAPIGPKNGSATVHTKQPLSIELRFGGVEETEIEVFPNPCQNSLSIRMIKTLPMTVHVFDGSGKVVLTAKGNGPLMLIDTSLLAEGLYNVEINCAGFNTTHSILKAK